MLEMISEIKDTYTKIIDLNTKIAKLKSNSDSVLRQSLVDYFFFKLNIIFTSAKDEMDNDLSSKVNAERQKNDHIINSWTMIKSVSKEYVNG